MGSSPQLPLPMWNAAPDDAERVVRDVHGWARSAALADLVDASGGSASNSVDLSHLDEFAAQHWDFRAGSERDQSHGAQLGAELETLVLCCARALGLSGRELPQRVHYDVAILTGGMVRAGIVKPRYMRELMSLGIHVDRVVFLGAHRSFSTEEGALARSIGVPGADEVDAMVEGMRREFRIDVDPQVCRSIDPVSNASWGRWSWRTLEPILEVIAASSADPLHRRANTADTFRFWADRYVDGARSVLVITTPIYVPYQAAVAVETLGLEAGLAVETVGVSARATDLGEFTQPFTARHHLQELRSAIRGMTSLERALALRPQ